MIQTVSNPSKVLQQCDPSKQLRQTRYNDRLIMGSGDMELGVIYPEILKI